MRISGYFSLLHTKYVDNLQIHLIITLTYFHNCIDWYFLENIIDPMTIII
jgi:hypothetical protein